MKESLQKFSRKTVKIWRGVLLIVALLLAIFLVLVDMGNRGVIKELYGHIFKNKGRA